MDGTKWMTYDPWVMIPISPFILKKTVRCDPNLFLPFPTSCVILDKLCDLSETSFSHLDQGSEY